MRVVSSAVSLGTHIAVVTAALLGTARQPVKAGPAVTPRIIFPNSAQRPSRSPVIAPLPIPDIGADWSHPVLDGAIPVLHIGAAVGAIESPKVSGTPLEAGAGPMWSPFAETTPEVLSGPLPRYPDLLRQAGIQGRVVLEATVDTTGRAERASIFVAEATNPAFIGPATDALLATLFRPGRVNGQGVRVRVRIPYEFTIRDGTARAR